MSLAEPLGDAMTFPSFLAAAKAIPDAETLIVNSESIARLGSEGEPFPEGMEVWGDAEIRIERLDLAVDAQQNPPAAFAAAMLHYDRKHDEPFDEPPLDLQRQCQRIRSFDRKAPVDEVCPLRGVSWENIVDCLVEEGTMAQLHVEALARDWPGGPPLACPFVDDGNTRIVLAFLGTHVYWFQMDTS